MGIEYLVSFCCGNVGRVSVTKKYYGHCWDELQRSKMHQKQKSTIVFFFFCEVSIYEL